MNNFGIKEALATLDIRKNNLGVSTGSKWYKSASTLIDSFSPVDGKRIAGVYACDETRFNQVVDNAKRAFKEWRKWPAPKRGEIVRQIGEALRLYKEPLGKLVSYEMGKSYQEGLGEVQRDD